MESNYNSFNGCDDMSDDIKAIKKHVERMDDLMTQFIGIVGHTDSMVADLHARQNDFQAGLDELRAGQTDLRSTQNLMNESLSRIEHRLEVIELRHDKVCVRLDHVAAEVVVLREGKQVPPPR